MYNNSINTMWIVSQSVQIMLPWQALYVEARRIGVTFPPNVPMLHEVPPTSTEQVSARIALPVIPIYQIHKIHEIAVR